MSGWVGDAVGDIGDVGDLSAWDQGDPLLRVGRGTLGLRSGFSGIVGNMRTLGMLSDDLLGPLEVMTGALQITAGGYQAYKAVQLALASYRAAQAALVATETAAAVANPFMWPALALAAGASATVYAALQYQSGEWDLPGSDISSPAGQDQAALAIGGVTNGQ